MGCKKDILSLPILSGCPANDELILFNNVVGGWSNGQLSKGAAWRHWSSIKNCIIGKYPFELAVTVPGDLGDEYGYIYQNNDLINALDVNWLLLNDGPLSKKKGDFDINYAAGEVNFFPNKLYGQDDLVIPYAKYTNISGVSPTVNDPIFFSEADYYDLAWTPELYAANGAGGSFAVYTINENDEYQLIIIAPIADTLPYPTNYHFDFGGTSTGYILIN